MKFKRKENASPILAKRQENPPPTIEKRIPLTDDLLWGVHPVYEALLETPERLTEILLVKDRKGKKLEEIAELARQKKVKIILLSAFRLIGEGAAEIRHQGILARTSSVPVLPFAALMEKFAALVAKGERPRIVACDSLQDPHNVGAIIRSALAAGAMGVILTRERSAPLSGTVEKSSAGAVSHIDICQVTNLVSALQSLKKAGAWVFGAVKDATAQSLYATDLRVPACVVVGSEGQGIRPLVRRECDIVLSIPMVGRLDSLNSSVAAAVILFEALRQNSGGE